MTDWTPDDLKAWRKRMGLRSQADAGAMVRAGTGSWEAWENGKRPVPPWLPLACGYLEGQHALGGAREAIAAARAALGGARGELDAAEATLVGLMQPKDGPS